MTPSDAAALALLALHDRRLASALVRVFTDRATAEDLDALPPDDVWRARLAGLQAEADAQLARAARLGIAAIPIVDSRYPPLLAAVPNPPPMVWMRGECEVLRRPCVALVGSRAATPYALGMAARLAADLASAGCVIVSGLARGVDSAAHAAALSARGKTVGVLGCGLDRVYPSEHAELARNMEHAGAVVSEFPAGVPPLPHHFPMRNRIISGLSIGVVVVEAPEKSGALITASAALEQGREVMVVPGLATTGRNRGGHLLIRDGAKVVETADDILQDLAGTGVGPPGGRARRAPEAAEQLELADLSDFTVDELAHRTGEPPHVVLARLLELELAGRIQRIGGGRFVRVLT
jgi:DNA processing protein